MARTEMNRTDSDIEKFEQHHVDEVARSGQAATDIHGHALVEIDPKAELALVRKLDLIILPSVLFCYIMCFVDRANIGNARIAGMEASIGMRPTDYGGYGFNLLLTAFYIGYIVVEPFAAYVAKLMGPGRFLAVITILFGILSFGMAFIHTFGQGVAVRLLLGIAESGFFPMTSFFLSRFYKKRSELSLRLGIYITFAPLSGACGGLLASGFLATPGFGMIRGWRIIFFAEGLMTIGAGLIALVVLPNSPKTCRWLSPEERALATARLKAENVGAIEHVDEIDKKTTKDALFNTTTLLNSVSFLFGNMVVQGLTFWTPSLVAAMYPRVSLVGKQLRTTPPFFVGALATVIGPYLAGRMRMHGLWIMIFGPIWAAGYAIFLGSNVVGVRYFGCFLIAVGAFPIGALLSAWSAINTTSDTARVATLGMMSFIGNFGGLAATWTYIPKLNRPVPRESQLPGNALNLVGGLICFALAVVLWLHQIRQNKAKEAGRDDHLVDGKTPQEIARLGQKHPGFRFQY
ncbi:hypothetical protein ACM66B_002058 [Microbotryomycetes sp. NB124-2]